MALVQMRRWEPFRDLFDTQGDMARFFERALDRDVSMRGSWSPNLDIYETDERFVVTVDVPGMTSEDIHVTLDRNLLTVRGERSMDTRVDEEQYHRVERRYGSFERTVSLPSQVDPDGIAATCADGVLEIIVPKAAEAKPRTIKVGEGARQLSS